MYRKADSSRFAFGIPLGMEQKEPGRQRKEAEEDSKDGRTEIYSRIIALCTTSTTPNPKFTYGDSHSRLSHVHHCYKRT